MIAKKASECVNFVKIRLIFTVICLLFCGLCRYRILISQAFAQACKRKIAKTRLYFEKKLAFFFQIG
jgi:hypothetical protein